MGRALRAEEQFSQRSSSANKTVGLCDTLSVGGLNGVDPMGPLSVITQRASAEWLYSVFILRSSSLQLWQTSLRTCSLMGTEDFAVRFGVLRVVRFRDGRSMTWWPNDYL